MGSIDFARLPLLLFFFAAFIFFLSGCGNSQAPPPKPPEVEVTPVVQRDVPLYSEWVATLDGYVNAQIKTQVTGYLIKQVVAYDISDEILGTAKQRFEGLAARYEQAVAGAAGGLALVALARIAYSFDLAEAVRDADLVIKAVRTTCTNGQNDLNSFSINIQLNR